MLNMWKSDRETGNRLQRLASEAGFRLESAEGTVLTNFLFEGAGAVSRFLWCPARGKSDLGDRKQAAEAGFRRKRSSSSQVLTATMMLPPPYDGPATKKMPPGGEVTVVPPPGKETWMRYELPLMPTN